jgi:tetratricopeptide (TPR) repeat protein
MVAATAATISLFGGVFANGSSSAKSASRPAAALSRPDEIARLQDRARREPRNVEALVALGLAYQQKARETADTSWYPKSEGILGRARRLRPRSAPVLSALGSLALARHRFGAALRLGREAVALQPDEARHWGVVGDALVELGRYDAAFRAFDRMATLEPGVSSYSRISYARELLGRPRAAIAPMRLAVQGSPVGTEAYAWGRVQLGKLLWSMGRATAAEREYRVALRTYPGYVHALDALAQVEAGRKHWSGAVALERRAVNAVPLPQFVAALGDFYRVSGRWAEARRQYALIGAIDRILVANGVKTDLEIALFDVDHGIGLRRALARARLAHRERPSIDADDVLGWALARTGHCGEALRYSKRALRLGTRDALKFFHRGMIERCLGRRAEARKWFRDGLDLNPRFSVLWAPVARRAVR